MSPTLPERLRRETRSLHTQVERSTFMSALLRGKLNRRGYLALLRNLQPIYDAIEAALRVHANAPTIAPLQADALFRGEALARDLAALGGNDDSNAIGVLPACEAYVARLRAISADGPADLLVAHAYARYLGDLSGGQVLRRIVSDSYGLSPGEGTAFYQFGDAARTSALAARFRDSLEEVGRISQADGRTDAIVGEAIDAFERHRALFDELALACELDAVR